MGLLNNPNFWEPASAMAGRLGTDGANNSIDIGLGSDV